MDAIMKVRRSLVNGNIKTDLIFSSSSYYRIWHADLFNTNLLNTGGDTILQTSMVGKVSKKRSPLIIIIFWHFASKHQWSQTAILGILEGIV